MRAQTIVNSLIVAIGAVAFSLAAGPDQHAHPAAPSNPGFEKLKSLAGEWTGTADGMESEHPDGVNVTYRLTGAGSAVMETLFPGTEHEMVTIYHMDRGNLVLTHYCAMGNQPHMKAEPFKTEPGKPAVLRFTCTGNGSNMESENEPHMHALELTFTDADHIIAHWTMTHDGKPGHEANFKLARKKS